MTWDPRVKNSQNGPKMDEESEWRPPESPKIALRPFRKQATKWTAKIQAKSDHSPKLVCISLWFWMFMCVCVSVCGGECV